VVRALRDKLYHSMIYRRTPSKLGFSTCVPRSLFGKRLCVPLVSHAAGENMEPLEVDKVIRGEK
jgi:hypothetical protein